MKVLDNVYTDYYVYEDSLNNMNWELLDSMKNILGYECQYAKCRFRGREYFAWFTPQVAVNEGPWKFHGLPGLIMEVYDSRNQYHFTISSIYPCKNPQDIIILPEKTPEGNKYIKTQRKDFLRLSVKYSKDAGGYSGMMSSVHIEGVTDSKPKILKYDLMERDYKE